MSSLVRHSGTIARATRLSLRTPSRTILASARFQRPSLRVGAIASSRCYSTNKPGSDKNSANKPPQKKGDEPELQNTSSPGPTEGKAPQSAADESPQRELPEGYVHLTKEDLETLWNITSLAYGNKSKRDEIWATVIEPLKTYGAPKELHDLIQKKRDGNLSLSDTFRLFQVATKIANHVASIQSDSEYAARFKSSSRDAENGKGFFEPNKKANEQSAANAKDGHERSKSEPDDHFEGQKSNQQERPRSDESSKGPEGSEQPDGKSPQGFKLDFWNTAFSTLVVVLLWDAVFGSSGGGKEITWEELRKNYLDKGLVERFIVHKDRVLVQLNREALQSVYPDSAATAPGFQVYFSIGSIESFERRVDEAQKELDIPSSERIPISYAHSDGMLKTLLITFGPTLLFLAPILFLARRGGGGVGGNAFGFGKSRAKKFNHETAIKVKFADVAGMDEAKQEIVEFVSFLKQPERFQRLGAKIPRGAILSGPPGTGKTLLAKATAGESGVPFFSVSGSEFVEMFVGVGASRVRDLFQTARKNSPCIIFIDEIDAIGRSRQESGPRFGGNDEREATLNQILTEMDGFNTAEQVVVLAGTNRADVLDKALMRPGRFDRHINIDRPTMKGRQDIFKVYLPKIVTNEDIEYLCGRLSALTPGFAGADIANCVNEAALVAARENATSVTMKHFETAIERVIGGLERKSLVLNPEEKRTVAYHEAGHAICGWYFRYADPLLKVSIIPRGQGALGYAQYLPGDAYLMNINQLMDRMAMTLGGRVSEELHFPTVTTGASDDFKKVSHMATTMVTQWGMSEKVGLLHFQNDENSFKKPFSETTAQVIDAEVKRIVEQAYKQCRDLLESKRKEIALVAEELLSKEMLTRDDMVRLLGPRPFDDREDFQKYFGGSGGGEKSAPPPPPSETIPPTNPVDGPQGPVPTAFTGVETKNIR